MRVTADTPHHVWEPADDADTQVEVRLGAGELWASVPAGGVEVHVNHGFDAFVTLGSVMIDAGEGDDGLMIVTAGEALLVDLTGVSRVLVAGEAAVLGAQGELTRIEAVATGELADDPWALANRELDGARAAPEPPHDGPSHDEPERSNPWARRSLRALTVGALVGAIVLLAFLLREDEPATTTEVGNPATSVVSTPTTSTTVPGPGIDVRIIACTRRADAIVAAGTVQSNVSARRGYRLTIAVRGDERVLGIRTAMLAPTEGADGLTPWNVVIPVADGAAGAARCEVDEVRFD